MCLLYLHNFYTVIKCQSLVTYCVCVASISSAINCALHDYLILQKDLSNVSGLYDIVISEVEKTLITKILKTARYNKNKTSKVLGISRNTLNAKIDALGISVPKIAN